MQKKLRVAVVGTGNIGGIAVRVMQGRDDVELVGVWGRSKNIGVDAGLLDTDTPCGVIITDKEADIFALKPDCAVMALNLRDPREAQVINGAWFIKLLKTRKRSRIRSEVAFSKAWLAAMASMRAWLARVCD